MGKWPRCTETPVAGLYVKYLNALFNYNHHYSPYHNLIPEISEERRYVYKGDRMRGKFRDARMGLKHNYNMITKQVTSKLYIPKRKLTI